MFVSIFGRSELIEHFHLSPSHLLFWLINLGMLFLGFINVVIRLKKFKKKSWILTMKLPKTLMNIVRINPSKKNRSQELGSAFSFMIKGLAQFPRPELVQLS